MNGLVCPGIEKAALFIVEILGIKSQFETATCKTDESNKANTRQQSFM